MTSYTRVAVVRRESTALTFRCEECEKLLRFDKRETKLKCFKCLATYELDKEDGFFVILHTGNMAKDSVKFLGSGFPTGKYSPTFRQSKFR